jgi:hypothetical protein
MLVDLPRTVALSAEIFVAAGVAERVTTAGQSFFDALPPGVDVYLLGGFGTGVKRTHLPPKNEPTCDFSPSSGA